MRSQWLLVAVVPALIMACVSSSGEPGGGATTLLDSGLTRLDSSMAPATLAFTEPLGPALSLPNAFPSGTRERSRTSTPDDAGWVYGSSDDAGWAYGSTDDAGWPYGSTVNVVTAFGAKCDGKSDDSVPISNCLAETAGSSCCFLPTTGCSGAYSVQHTITVPSGACLVGNGAPVQSVITPTPGGDGYLNAAFFTSSSTIRTTTLSVNATKGSYGLNLTSVPGFSAGQTILAQNPSGRAQLFTVTAVSATTISTDDPVEFSFVAGDVVSVVTAPSNITFDGLVGSGTGDRFIELAACQHCAIRNVQVNSSFTGITMSFDVGGRDNLYDNVTVDGGGISAIGLGMESQVRSQGHNVWAYNMASGGTGIDMVDSQHSTLQGAHAWGQSYGLCLIPFDQIETDGAESDSVSDSDFSGNTVDGVYVVTSSELHFSNVSASNNGRDGFYLSDAMDVRLSGVQANGNTGNGVEMAYTSTGCVGVDLSDLTASDNNNAGITWTGPYHQWRAENLTINRGGYGIFANGGGVWTVDGFLSTDANINGAGSLVVFGQVSDATINHAHVRHLASTHTWDILDSAGAFVNLDDYTAEVAGGSGTTAIIDSEAAGNYRLSNTHTIGALTFGVVCNSSGTLRLKPSVDLQSVTAGGGMAVYNGGSCHIK